MLSGFTFYMLIAFVVLSIVLLVNLIVFIVINSNKKIIIQEQIKQ